MDFKDTIKTRRGNVTLFYMTKVKPKKQYRYPILYENANTNKREMSGLVRACKTLALREGTIIIHDGHKMEEEINNIKIHIISVVEYLLS